MYDSFKFTKKESTFKWIANRVISMAITSTSCPDSNSIEFLSWSHRSSYGRLGNSQHCLHYPFQDGWYLLDVASTHRAISIKHFEYQKWPFRYQFIMFIIDFQ